MHIEINPFIFYNIWKLDIAPNKTTLVLLNSIDIYPIIVYTNIVFS